MRRTLLALAIATIPGLGAAAGLPSSIGAVTVYQDRAVVTRGASSAELPAGEHELVLEKLPASLQENSVQVSANSTGQATLLDVKVSDAFQADAANARVRQLEDQLRELEGRHGALEDEAAVLDNQRELVLMMQRGATEPGKDGARPTLEELKAIQSLSADSLARTLAALRQVGERKATLERDIEALRNQLARLQDTQARRSKTVTLRVNLARAGKVDLNLTYAVGGAHWTPAYDARLRLAERSVDLGYFGVIRQNTGEDWNNVKLTLSTARPSLGGGAPALQPWIVDVAAPPPPPAPTARKQAEIAAESRARSGAPMEDAAYTLARPAPRPVEVVTAQVQNEATSASFQIKNPATLPSDNTTQRVAIAAAKLPATLQYQSTPALRETAYLTAQASNGTAFPFLAGPLNTYLDDAFVAAGRLKAVMPGEKMDLALGADDGISIKRELVSRYTESTGFSGSGQRVTYEYKFTVKNNKATKERISFKDRLPVSRYEKITVKLLSPAERDIKREADGRIAWDWELEPGKTRETVFKFSVDYPADVEVSGL